MKETAFPGALLRERREALGHTAQSVCRHIHVPLQCLNAFETGVFDGMPGRAYALGFLRSYCRFLDVEPDLFVDQYLLCTQPPQSGGAFNFMRRAESGDTPARPWPRWYAEALAWGSVCAVILLGWVTYNVVVQPIAESWKSRAEASAVEVEAPIHFQEDF